MFDFDFSSGVYTDSLESPLTFTFDAPEQATYGFLRFNLGHDNPSFNVINCVSASTHTQLGTVYNLVTTNCLSVSNSWDYSFSHTNESTLNHFKRLNPCPYTPEYLFTLRHDCQGSPCPDGDVFSGSINNVQLDGFTGVVQANYASSVVHINATWGDFSNLNINASFLIQSSLGYLSGSVCADSQEADTVTSTLCDTLQNTDSLQNTSCDESVSTELITNSRCDNAQEAQYYNRPTLCSVTTDTTNLNRTSCDSSEEAEIFNGVNRCDTSDTTFNITNTPCDNAQITDIVHNNILCSLSENTFGRLEKTTDLIEGLSDSTYSPTPIFKMLSETNFCQYEWLYGATYDQFDKFYNGILSRDTCMPVRDNLKISNTYCDKAQISEVVPYGQTPWEDPVDPEDPIDPTDLPTQGNIILPVIEEITMIDTVTATLDNGTVVGISSINLHLDTSLHSWTCSMTLADTTQKDLIQPKEDGTAIVITLVINGYSWKIIIEEINTVTSFNNEDVSISGRSHQAILSEPYTRPSSVSHGVLMTTQQIAESFMPIGWTINWGASLPIWDIPANTYSHNNLSPASALLELIHSCGGMLIPHPNLQEFTVAHRYPVKPWEYNPTSPNYTINDSLIFESTESPVSKYGVNGVVVHGETGSGKQALVRRTGTAGDKLATTTSNPLMVDMTSIRSLGQRIVAGGQPQPEIKTISTFMDGTTVPFINIGSFIEILKGGNSSRGIVNAVDIAMTLQNDVPVVNQKLTIGEANNNIYHLLQSIVPTYTSQLASLTSTDGITSLVALVGGDSVRVKGTGTVGNKYYIKQGSIEASAPNLSILPDIVI